MNAVPLTPRHRGLAYSLRCLYVLATTEFKLKYAGSMLGYVWSLARPLAYFSVLWVVFGHFFRGIVAPVPHFPLYLLLGIVLYTFFTDAVGVSLTSLVSRAEVLRKLAFPRVLMPTAAVTTACMTFAVNLTVVAILVLAAGIRPSLDWLAIVPLLLELVAFVVGLGLIASSLYVRFRDISPLWELTAQLLIFAAPIMYPLAILPEWARKVELLNPLVQVMQDLRHVVIGIPAADTASGAFATGRLAPVAIALGTLVAGVLVFRREAARLPERV